METAETAYCHGEEHLLKASSGREHILGVVVFCWPEQYKPEVLAPALSHLLCAAASLLCWLYSACVCAWPCGRDAVQGPGGTESICGGVNPSWGLREKWHEPRQPQRSVGQCHTMTLPVCARRHLGKQCRLLCSVKGAWFMLAVLCPKRTCCSRVP